MTTTPATARFSTFRSKVARWLTPRTAHLVILALAALFSLVVATRVWFFFDDWAFLVPSLEDPWLPHVGHWSTAPYIIFHALRDLFGLNSFLPFAIPVTIAHLALVHLVWRFMRRVGIHPWLSTAASGVLAFLGAGSENFLWAFQVGFIGAMALTLGVLLILLRDRLRLIDVVVIVGLSIIAPMFSGTALPLLAVAGIVGWMRHGLLRVAAMLAPAAVAYLTWFVLVGRFAPPAGRANGIAEVVTLVPAFGLKMLTDGFARAFPVEVLGPLAFAAVSIWGVLTWTRSAREERPAYVLFAAAPLFALFTGYSRVNLGLDTATSSRYLYFIIPVMMPLMMLALDYARRRWALALGPLIVLIGVLALYNFGGLLGTVANRSANADLSEQRLSAAVDVLAADSDHDIAGAAQPYPLWTPDVSAHDLAIMHDVGWFDGQPYGDTAYLSALVNLETHVETGGTAGRCQAVEAEQTVDLPLAFVIETDADTALSIALRSGSTVGDARALAVEEGRTTVEVDATSTVRVEVTPAAPVELCLISD